MSRIKPENSLSANSRIQERMRYRMGRLLQVIGLLIAPIGMAGNLLNPDTISESHILLTLMTGGGFFIFGKIIQGSTPS